MTARTVTIQWSSPEDEMFTVRCRVSGGCPMRGPDMNGPGSPAEDPEVEILSARGEDKSDRPDIADMLADEHMDEIEEAAIGQAEEDELSAWEVECERRSEQDREDRYERERQDRADRLVGVLRDIVGGGR